MVNQKTSSWDVLHSHAIAKELDTDAKLALLCEFVDLYEELQGMTLADFVTAYFAPRATVEVEPDPEDDEEEEVETTVASSSNGDVAEAEVKPASLIGLRVVYRFPGRNVLSDKTGVTRDSENTVAFTDVDGEPWSNVKRDRVYVINPENRREVHIIPREAKEIKGWLAGTPSKEQPEGAVLRSLFVEFTDFPEKIAFAIMNGKRPYVDRFVQLPKNGFADDQKPTTRLFGEHCFWIHGQNVVVEVMSP